MNIGDKVRVEPEYLNTKKFWKTRVPELRQVRTGTVIYVNVPHRHCVVEFPNGVREGFKIVNPEQFASGVKIPQEGKHFDVGGYR